MKIDPHFIAGILQDCADEFIVPRYQNLLEGDIKTKAHANDFVTIADTETEAALVERLTAANPGCVVIGEEGVSSGYASLDVLEDPGQYVFVVDPVDGTKNFKEGRREFAVMMSLNHNGQTIASWIYDVLGRSHYIAEQGAGVYRDGTRLTLAPTGRHAPDITGYSRKAYFPPELQPLLGHLAEAQKSVRSIPFLFCAAHEYIRIISGTVDFSIYGTMRQWDHLAGSLMVREAGGVSMKWDRSFYKPADANGGLISAASQQIWDDVQKLFIQPILDLNNPVGLPPLAI